MKYRPHRIVAWLFVATVAAVFSVGCGSDDSPEFTLPEDTGGRADTGGGESDTGRLPTDTGGDVGVESDAEVDAGSDATEDTGGDATEDAGGDTAMDVGGDTATDVGGDTAMDVGGDTATDTGADAEADVVEDVEPDVEVPPGCGDGVVDDGEECDDGNDINTDECSNACRIAICGDGITNSVLGEETFEEPVVIDPTGAEGRVCDDGGSCPGSTCNVYDDPFAPEHGICQAMGFDRAIEVSWEGGAGSEAGGAVLHADHWECFDYRCFEGEFASRGSSCTAEEMLTYIICEGIVGEECDDGEANGEEPDACRSDCTLPFCGDLIIDSEEECDDGNRVNDDGCSNTCLLPQCGDSVINGEEECDDGNDDDTDGCRNDCLFAYCGDEIVQTGTYAIGSFYDFEDGEISDDFGGAADWTIVPDAADGTTSAIRSRDIGDGESVELTRTIVTESPTTVSFWLKVESESCCDDLEFFVDGVRQGRWAGIVAWTEVEFEIPPGEHTLRWVYAKDGSVSTAGDSAWLDEILIGENVLVAEDCDEGADNSDEADATCRTDCTAQRCGDAITDSDEECDDGNEIDDDGCANDCMLPICGDGIVQAGEDGGEECDDGEDNSDVDPDACRTDCTLPSCGDAVTDEGEECDDGNDIEDDGCSNICLEPQCGDGVTQPELGEECDDANSVDDDGCSNTCLLPQCGDGVVQEVLGEECDDGNDDNTDGCRIDCLFAYCGDGVLQAASSGACEPLILNDSGDVPAALIDLLAANDIVAEGRNNGSGTFTTDADLMASYPMVIFHNNNRGISEAEATALREYVEGGGTLLVTGYDSLGSPTDTRLAGVLNLTTTGDGPFSSTAEVVDASSPIMDGPFGTYAAGFTWTTASSDHDGATPVEGSSTAVATVSGRAKISFATDIGAGGTAMYWNGNSGLREWTSAGAPQNMLLNLLSAYCGGYEEECDEGEDNSDEPGSLCRTDCTLPGCGDGVVDGLEECDDGNDDDFDACSNACTEAVCGDGIIQEALGEECDDGDGNSDFDADACRTDCVLAFCGDGTLDSGEACDDGNLIEDDGCSNLCEEPGCGDGVVQVELGEECDDGNDVDDDACTNACLDPICGDGIVHRDAGEACDDGNDVDDDDCTNLCEFGPTYVPCGDESIAGPTGTFSGTTAGAGNDFTEYPSEDYAYGFTATEAATVTASLCDGASWDTRLVAYRSTDSCPGERVAMNDDACGVQSRISFPTVPGETYTVVVEAFSTATGAYTLTLSSDAP